MLVQILIGLVVLVVVVVGYASTRPDKFRIERSVRIAAPASALFPLVDDYKNWVRWSPWENIDADLKRTYGQLTAGKGGYYAWEGKKSGAGTMETIASAPNTKIVIKLDFIKPFEAHNTTEFDFVEEGGATTVTWVMHGASPLPSKIMGLFMDMDTMVGKDFEKGLASLKSQVGG